MIDDAARLRNTFMIGAEWEAMNNGDVGRPGFYGEIEAEALRRYPDQRGETPGDAIAQGALDAVSSFRDDPRLDPGTPTIQTHAGNPDVYPKVRATRVVVGHVEPATPPDLPRIPGVYLSGGCAPDTPETVTTFTPPAPKRHRCSLGDWHYPTASCYGETEREL